MLPVVAGKAATTRLILIYSALLAPISVLPWPLGFAGPIYGATAVVCGGTFVGLALRLDRSSKADRKAAHRLFAFSIAYLFLLFAALLTGSMVNRGFLASTVWTYSAPAQVESLASSVRTGCSYVLMEDEA
jgi:protoheme IX farnesyltransferase